MGYLLAMGPDELLGCAGDCEPVCCHSLCRPDLALLIRGDYVVGDATLNRFFSFHVIAVPLVLLGLGGCAHHCAARSRLQQS
jgi:ubiquinol-cytochrome c reductase cytochrome b subunit